MTEIFLPIMETRRAKPTDDFVSHLVTAEINGDRISAPLGFAPGLALRGTSGLAVRPQPARVMA